jgi:two-component system sensor histidine kinase UhpB
LREPGGTAAPDGPLGHDQSAVRFRTTLFWRVFLTNSSLVVAAAVLLAVGPATVSAPIALTEAVVLAVGAVVIVVVNLLLLRPSFEPLERLARRMASVDLLRPGQRLGVSGSAEVAALVASFNDMLGRLEREREASSRRAIAAQEAERLHIARTLHDEIGQRLTSILLRLDAVSANVGPPASEQLERLKEDVRDTLDELRSLSRGLRPEALDQLGLTSALASLAAGFSADTGIQVERRLASDLPELAPEAQLAIYRVAQESLTNVARHADAGRVLLVLESDAGSVVLRVVDDGRGLPREGVASSGGLRGMRERALLVGAALAIKEADGGGVEVRMELPAAGR